MTLRHALVVLLAAIASAAFAQTPPKPPQVATCEACHGPNGNSTIPINPSLAGQTWRYIYIELKDFNEGRRSGPILGGVSTRTRSLIRDSRSNSAATRQPVAAV